MPLTLDTPLSAYSIPIVSLIGFYPFNAKVSSTATNAFPNANSTSLRQFRLIKRTIGWDKFAHILAIYNQLFSVVSVADS